MFALVLRIGNYYIAALIGPLKGCFIDFGFLPKPI